MTQYASFLEAWSFPACRLLPWALLPQSMSTARALHSVGIAEVLSPDLWARPWSRAQCTSQGVDVPPPASSLNHPRTLGMIPGRSASGV